MDGEFGDDADGGRADAVPSASTQEDLTNQVEGRALPKKTTVAVCRFLIEDVVCRYGCVGKIVADRGELDAQEAEELFEQ